MDSRARIDEQMQAAEQHAAPGKRPIAIPARPSKAGEDGVTTQAAGAAAMRTVLRQFSGQFDQSVGPLLGPLRIAADMLAAAPEELGVHTILPDLRDLWHNVEVLIDKVAQQQAYVLIFGPLKSGKSTFMNALCSTYVSEVTSLPAYPCIVQVGYNDRPLYAVTRYDGHREEFSGPQPLYQVMDRGYADLTARIREVESGQEQFEPSLHMPQAIRKIDVKLPIDDLAQSGAVLVDTPGLYSRMKFGYDRMTRDFRDSAACAIFIVKTDNLFLEQVFDEFQELLDLFSRVFLIVNLDSAKQDLRPDGTLGPSLEHEDPGRIIEAFRDLAMSAPLKAAADAGRLRIYATDILSAASRRIRAAWGKMPVELATAAPAEKLSAEQTEPDETKAEEPTPAESADAEDPDAELADDSAEREPADEPVKPEEVDKPAQRSGDSFENLLADLTDYLNSSEYMRSFLSDSLRRAGSLLDGLRRLLAHQSIGQLGDRAGALRRQRDQAVARRDAVGRLKHLDWREHTHALRVPLARSLADQAHEIRQGSGLSLVGAVDAWFDNDASLADLNQGDVVPMLGRAQDQLEQFGLREMSRRVNDSSGGLALDETTERDLHLAGLKLDELARSAIDTVGSSNQDQPIMSDLTAARVPIKRTVWDWMLLRGTSAVRNRCFGPEDDPVKSIGSAAKSRRLGPACRRVMRNVASVQLARLLDYSAIRLPSLWTTTYLESLSSAARAELNRLAEEAARKLSEIEARLAETEHVLHTLAKLRETGSRIAGSVSAMAADLRY